MQLNNQSGGLTMSNNIQTKLHSLNFGDKFTLNPQSKKTWIKSTVHQKLDGTVTRIVARRTNNNGECYFDPSHIVYKEAGA